jgi:hypothetical protein
MRIFHLEDLKICFFSSVAQKYESTHISLVSWTRSSESGEADTSVDLTCPLRKTPHRGQSSTPHMTGITCFQEGRAFAEAELRVFGALEFSKHQDVCIPFQNGFR